MTFVIHANLDCEARWAGTTLPGAVATRVSHYAALLAALAPGDLEIEVWAPAAIDPARLCPATGWTPPVMRVGAPPRADLVWADSKAKAANDRRLALRVATSRGAALPGAKVITSVDQVAAIAGPWVAKSPWTTAGRDRCHGAGAPTDEQRTRLTRLLERSGELVLEPWVERVLDLGVCATVLPDGLMRAEPHHIVTDARGTFLGIDLAPPPLSADESRQLFELVSAAGGALGELGYVGRFAVDAFVHRTADGERRMHPLCEINARCTFGWVARALHTRFGTTELGFSTPPPGATVLIAPADDGVTAWVA
ncbi:MAG: hypothetical protein JWP01_1575 [Myxococcales bacterium]|nr:hypothetical protein [Myxococcales bacterium]